MASANYVGRAVLDGKVWTITADPDVMIRLKQVFPAINKANIGRVYLSDTPATARDLLWFAERYPIEFVPRARVVMQAAVQHQREQTVRQILSDGYVPPDVQLAIPAREYQKIAATLILKGAGILIADDYGIGKTVSAIAAIANKEALPAVVVTLTHLPRQWAAEINRFAPNLRVHVVREGKPYDLTRGPYNRALRAYDKLPMPDVLVFNYHRIAGWAEFLVANDLVRTVIFDECQELRHRDTAKYNAAVHVRSAAGYCGGLSATPIYNYGGEMHNVMNVIQPGVLGAWSEFVREWCSNQGGDSEKAKVTDPAALGTYLRRTGAMIRRTRQEVGRELPPITKVVHQVELDEDPIEVAIYQGDGTGEDDRTLLDRERSEEEKQKIDARLEALAKTILATSGRPADKMRAAGELDWRLREATGISKAVYVANFVRMIIESGERVVLYGWHRAVYALWLRVLADMNPAMYTGSEGAKQKDDSKRRFIDRSAEDHTPILIMSLRSGAGLDGLQGTSNITVHGELDWSPKVHDQGDARVHRDGQANPVTAYYLVADSGSDPVIADVLNIKEFQSDGVINPGRAASEPLQGGDAGRIRRLAQEFLRGRGIG